MEKLKYRYEMVHKTIDTLQAAIKILEDPQNEHLYKTCRNSAIQRFEYSVDTLWKFLKSYLQEKHAITFTIISPKEVFRKALDTKIVSEVEYNILLECLVDRNMTSHAYKEVIAQELIERIPRYSKSIHAYYRAHQTVKQYLSKMGGPNQAQQKRQNLEKTHGMNTSCTGTV